jgi:hypothetical protein
LLEVFRIVASPVPPLLYVRSLIVMPYSGDAFVWLISPTQPPIDIRPITIDILYGHLINTVTPPYRVDPPVPSAVSRILPESLVPARSGVTVWWSGIKREGEWILPRIFRVFTFMGNTEIDLTLARIGAGESEIEVLCIFGNVEITVPRDIRVLSDGDGVVGSFDIHRIGDTTPPLDAPTLRITGTAYLGSVTVHVKGLVGPGWKEKLIAGWQSWNA